MRVLVLCNEWLSPFDLSVLNHIQREQLPIVGVLINVRPKPGIWQRVKRELRKGRGAYVLIQAANHLFRNRSGNNSKRTKSFCLELDIPYLETASLRNSDVFSWMRAQ
ncbi:MAG TPA: hypothetical protein PLV32_13310, partial [Chitinophagaceae bacterium]|nr:hypothetical protein [Chitinophagaceae bacterium]